MDKVVALPGHPLPPKQGQPDEIIVRRLEDLLEQARAGQICAFAFAAYRATDTLYQGWACGAYAFHLAASIMALQEGYARMLNESD